MEAEIKEAKKIRRNAKAALTRSGKWLINPIEAQRPGSEVRETLSETEESYKDLVVKHEDHTKLIDDDVNFEEAKSWMEKCQDTFMTYVMQPGKFS